MAASLEELPTTSSNGLLDVRPDRTFWCHDASSTANADYWDIKPEITSDDISTTTSQQFAVQLSFFNTDVDDTQFDLKPLACVLCDKLQLTVCNEKLHRRPLVDLDKPFLCITCHQQFCTQEQLFTHSIMTCPVRYIKAEPIEAAIIGQIITHSTEVMTAPAADNNRKKRFTCTLCQQQFSRQCRLQEHVKKKHNGKRFACNHCQRQFIHQHNLKRHVEHEHSGVRRHVCDVCQKAFYKNYNLQRHMLSHTGELSFSFGPVAMVTSASEADNCSSCNKTFACTQCQRHFLHQRGLKQHVEHKHLGVRRYVCDDCQKAFHTKQHLDNHVLIHTGEKPYKCRFCDKSMTQKCHLVMHERSHAEEKPFKCRFCDKSMVVKRDMVMHERIHTRHSTSADTVAM